MGSEWITHKLEDCLAALIDYRGKTPHKIDSGIPLVTAKIVKAGRIEAPTEYISEADYTSWMTRGFPALGDVVMTTEAPLGEVGQILELPVALAQRVVTLRGKEGVLDSDYLLYALQSEGMQARLRDRSTGTTVLGIKQSELRKVEIEIPPIELQRAVVSALKCLDDRIDLLRQTNTTLESIAQALFKSWFVDFDPVHAKAEGSEPEAMDAATATLFPSEFEESELGPIPKGWDVEILGGAANVIDCLHAKKPELLNNGRPYLQLNCIRSDGLLDVSAAAAISDDDYEKWTSRIEARAGDCVITNVGRVGAVAQIPCNYLAAIGRNMTAVRCKSTFPYPTVLIELLTSDFMRHEIEQKTDAGTILAALNVKNIPKLRFVRGADEVLENFETLCRPLRTAMEENLQRTNSLASLRDTLLPRLISGKLRLPDAAKAVEEAVA